MEKWPAQAAGACGHTHYIVTLRDPVARIVSAFNFQRLGLPLDYNASEHDHPNMLNGVCFPDVRRAPSRLRTGPDHCVPDGRFRRVWQFPGGPAAYAEALGQDTECGALARYCLHEPDAGKACGHLSMGTTHYLHDTGLMDVLRRPDKSVWVVRQESFSEDVAGLWEWLCVPPEQRVGEIHDDTGTTTTNTSSSSTPPPQPPPHPNHPP